MADLPTSAQAKGLAGTLEHVQMPPVVRAGAQVPIDVIARNRGQTVWLPEVDRQTKNIIPIDVSP